MQTYASMQRLLIMHIKIFWFFNSGNAWNFLLRIHRLITAVMFHGWVLTHAYRHPARVEASSIAWDHHILRSTHHHVRARVAHHLVLCWLFFLYRFHYLIVINVRGVFQARMVVTIMLLYGFFYWWKLKIELVKLKETYIEDFVVRTHGIVRTSIITIYHHF